jgi:putative PIN family toxin of toxin-antitoxin system
LEELESVLSRPKFDIYLTLSERLAFFDILRLTAVTIESVTPLAACRDPKDDKFLALAITGQAEFILSGDQDLLSLHPFRGIDILTPRQYLDRQHV